MIFWLKTRAGWRETIQNINLGLDMKKSADEYTDEELEAIIGLRNEVPGLQVLVIHTEEREIDVLPSRGK